MNAGPGAAPPPSRPTVGRAWHLRLHHLRHRFAPGSLAALLAVAGPGLLAGLSDDDPARHHQLLDPGRPLRLRAAVGADAVDRGPDRLPRHQRAEGALRLGRAERAATGVAIVAITGSVVALLALEPS